MHFKNLKTKAFSFALAGATALTLVAPVTANASTATVTNPTAPKATADANVATVAAHRAAETAPQFLGANLTTMESTITSLSTAQSSLVLNVFGSSWNENPDPYIWNYYYNFYAAQNGGTQVTSPLIAIMTASIGPDKADSSGVSTGTNADVYLGNAANGTYSYPSNLSTVSYNYSDLDAMVGTMYDLAIAMNAAPRAEGTVSGRYGDPEAIAQQYEEYVKATKLYVLSQLAADDEEQKKVAIVKGKSGDNYQLYTSSDAASQRIVDFLDGTVDNLGDSSSSLTAQQLAASGADYIILPATSQGGRAGGGGGGGSTSTGTTVTKDSLLEDNAVPADCDVIDVATVFPSSTLYGLTVNSVESAFGVGILQSIVYSEYLDLEDAVAYFYRNFYHISLEKVDEVADYNFEHVNNYDADKYVAPSEVPTNSGEDEDEALVSVESGIGTYAYHLEDGIEYYVDNYDTLSDGDLALSSYYPLNDIE